jgi:DNA-binding transcriptional LysR family regulator
MIVTSRPSLINCVRAKLGITLVPMLTRPIDMEGLAFVPLIRPRISRTIGIITRQNQTLLPAGAAMLDIMTRSLTQYTRRRGGAIVGPTESEKRPAKRLRIR